MISPLMLDFDFQLKSYIEVFLMSSSKRVNKSISIPFSSQDHYLSMVENPDKYRLYLQQTAALYPELFPSGFDHGFKFNGILYSQKQPDIKLRRILLTDPQGKKQSYQLRPSFIMPYMTATVEEVEKALYLLKWPVPFSALTYLFGHNDMFWYRAYISLGRNSIVGTTVKAAELLPSHLAADEKHTTIAGQKAYLATTAAQGCILGASLAEGADEQSLTRAYQEYKEESSEIDVNYRPQTVNTDGWKATNLAWKQLYPGIVTLLCYLHGWLKIRDRCKKVKDVYKEVREKVWHVYKARTVGEFSQRVRRLREWAQTEVKEVGVKEKLLALCDNRQEYKIAYSYPGAYRTSNEVDRVMNYQDRVLYGMQYFHGKGQSAKMYVRAMALIWNFHPYGQRTLSKDHNRHSPFKDLNGYCYAENWLENLLIASSMGGRRQ